MADVNRMFNYLENWKGGIQFLKACKTLIPCPTDFRKEFQKLVAKEVKNAKEGKPASMTLKMNSLSDENMIESLYEAARAGVEVKLIIRGICCMFTENKKFIKPVQAISIVDEYLEHARLYIFHNDGNEKVFISSADWMTRNIDHRVEATCPILDENIKKVLKTILEIQLNDNVKARILDNDLSNWYVRDKTKRRVRSQVDIYQYLYQQTLAITPTLQPLSMENLELTGRLEIITDKHETGSN